MNAKTRKGSSTSMLLRYIAFLRGINMIGHRPVKMDAVQKVFEQLGY